MQAGENSMMNLLRRWARSFRRSHPNAPVLDPLERRALLSAVLSPEGALAVTGTAGNDVMSLAAGDGGISVRVSDGSDTLSIFRLSSVRSITVSGGGGDDTLTVDTSGGLVALVGVALPLDFDGGAGRDTLRLVGAPAGITVNETISFGAADGSGQVLHAAADRSQSVKFAGVESLVDTSVAATLTLDLDDAANLVEILNGPLADGLATGELRAYEVAPCETHTAVPVPTTPTGTIAAAGSSASVAAGTSAAPVDAAPMTKKELARARAEAKREAKRRARELKLAAKAAKKAQKAAAMQAMRAARVAGLTPAPASTAPAAATAQELVIGRAYVPVQFANKARVTIDTGGGD